MRFIYTKFEDGRKVAFNFDEVLYFGENEEGNVFIEFSNEVRIIVNEKFEDVEKTFGRMK